MLGQGNKCFRKSVAKLLVFLMIFSSAMVIKPSAITEAATAKPTISKASKDILVGGTYDLNINHKVKNSIYQWSSSNKSVATVNKSGTVKGVKKGIAVINCKVKTPGRSYNLTSKVTIRVPATKFVISNKVTALNAGQKYDLNRTLAPVTSNDKTVWTSSDKKIAAPDSQGKFTALKEGTVTITGKTLSGKKDKVTIKVVDSQGTVATQVALEQLLGSGAVLITIKSDEAVTFTIPKGDYSSQKLVVNAPNADVINNGVFKSIDIQKIKANTFYEQAIGNVINVSAPDARIAVGENAQASISVNGNGTRLSIINNGTVKNLTLNADADVSIAGKSTQAVPITANTAGGTITSSIPLNLTCNQKINLVILPGAEATTIHVASADLIPEITGSTSVKVTIGEGDNAQVKTVEPTKSSSKTDTTAGGSTGGSAGGSAGGSTGGNITPVTPTPTPAATTGTMTGKVTVINTVSGSSIAVSGSSIAVSGGSIAVSGSSILANASVKALKYSGDIADAVNSIFNNPNTVVASTNENGIYSMGNLDPGNYVVVMSKDNNYKVLVQQTSITAGATTVVNGTLIQRDAGDTTLKGFASGDIINALTGGKVDDNLSFTVNVYKNFNNTSTSDLVLTKVVTGSAITLELPEGYYTMKVSDNRTPVVGTTYADTTLNIVVYGGTTFADQDIVLSTLKKAGQATFVLTWGEFPSDLDSHLIGPSATKNNYHIFFDNLTFPENIENTVNNISKMDLRLDLDDITSFGPETTSIYKPVAGGIYTFYVYNYSGNTEGTLVNSNAKVVVTTDLGTYSFEAPTTGTTERSWVVCTYNSATGEITPINKLVDGNYYNVLYGADIDAGQGDN